MAFKPIQKKKTKPAAAERKKAIEIERPRIVADVGLRLDAGDKVRKGRDLTRSWREDWG